jgi:hypothetical protein
VGPVLRSTRFGRSCSHEQAAGRSIVSVDSAITVKHQQADGPLLEYERRLVVRW